MAAKRGGRKRTVKMRKRHILVDSLGFLMNVAVHPADLQVRDGTRLASIDARAACSPSSNESSPMPTIR